MQRMFVGALEAVGLPSDSPYHPLNCPHVDASWLDRIRVVDAPVGLGVIGPCWHWLGWNNAKAGGAYGKVKIAGRADYIHRVMWQRSNNLYLRGGETVDHLCRVRLCFAPLHLDCASYAENNERAREYAERFRESYFDPELEAEIAQGFM